LPHTNYSQLLSSQEIEKTADEKILWSLYLPWELGRCAIESSGRQVDVRNVIWLGTSNIGHDLIFQYQELRRSPEELMSREEYLEVMGQLRPKVSERLGVRDFFA
jgi:ATP-dependent Clp protease ATP-binding subunit ClpA